MVCTRKIPGWLPPEGGQRVARAAAIPRAQLLASHTLTGQCGYSPVSS